MNKTAFIFNNTNLSISWEIFYIFSCLYREQENFIILIDKEYDLFSNDNNLYDLVYHLSDRHSSHFASYCNCVYFDFDTEYKLSNYTTIREYILSKINFQFEVKNLEYTLPKTEKVSKIIQDSDKNNFSTVLFVDSLMDHFNLDKDQKENNITLYTKKGSRLIREHFQNQINLVEVSLDSKLTQIELIELVSRCDAVISFFDICFLTSRHFDIPNFCMLGPEDFCYAEHNNCVIFDPFRNIKRYLPCKLFTQDYKNIKKINEKIFSSIDYSDQLIFEIDKFFNDFSIARHNINHTNTTEVFRLPT